MRYAVTTPVVDEPLALEDVKVFLRTIGEDTSEDEAVIIPLITTAREYCENYTGRSIAKQGVTAYLDCFMPYLFLPRPDVISVESIVYYDENGDVHTLSEDDYMVNNAGRLYIKNIPQVQLRKFEPIEITYTTGYEEIPKTLRQAMLMLVGHWYDNREAVIGGSRFNIVEIGYVPQLLNQYKAWWF